MSKFYFQKTNRFVGFAETLKYPFLLQIYTSGQFVPPNNKLNFKLFTRKIYFMKYVTTNIL